MTLLGSHLLRRCSQWALLLTSALAMGSGSANKGRPTTVPGSDHLVLSQDFPYQFWRARPQTPSVASTEHTDYGFFYGQAMGANSDPKTWKMLPIQIPDDLVGDLHFWTRGTTTELPAYPTSPTPQYGRHPGATEPPHLFHPERLYRNGSLSEGQTPLIWRRNQEGSTLVDQPESDGFPQESSLTKRPDLFSSWTRSLRERLEPYIDTTRLPKLPTLPKFSKLSSITPLPLKLPVWPLSMLRDKQKPQIERQADSSLANPMEHVIHKFYPILANAYPTDQSNTERRKNKRPSYIHPLNLNTDFSLSNSHAPNYDHSPTTQHLPDEGQHPYQGTNHDNIGYEHNHGTNHEYSANNFSPSSNNNPSVKHQKRPQESQSQSLWNSQVIQNRRQDIQEHEQFSHTGDQKRPQESQSQSLWNSQVIQNRRQDIQEHEQFSHTGDQHRPLEGQYHHTGNQHGPLRDQSRPEADQSHHVSNQRPNAGQNWPGSYSQAHDVNTLFKNQQSNQRNPSYDPYRNRPISGPLQPDGIYRRGPHQSHGSRPHYHPHQVHDYHVGSSEDWTDHLAHPALYSDSEAGIIERLTSLDPLSSSLVIPGGLVVVALALAVYYFTYVWYPTPVVTAKMIKLLSDSGPEDLLVTDQQKAIREVYEVFRGLEAEYTHDPALWSPSCKSRLVCQVHQELPGLWRVTQAYGALVRSSLAPGPEGDKDFTLYLKAAQQGTSGSKCGSRYPDCSMAPIPVRSTLQKLLGIPHGDYPEVVYS